MQRQSLVFWWNMPNPHTVPFFSSLAKRGRFDCRIVYEEHVPEWRRECGWRDEMGGLASDFLEGEVWKDHVREIVEETRDGIYIFSGVGAYEKPGYALQLALQRGISCYACTERSVSPNRLSYFFQRERNRLRRFRWGRQLNGMFAIGGMAKEYFHRIGYREEQLYDWMYFVENRHLPIPNKPQYPVRIVFVGQMIPRKGVDTFLHALGRVQGDYRVDLYGAGSHLAIYQEMGEKLLTGREVKWHGTVANERVVEELPGYDILVLPSQGRGDGWGAVVNEGINAGCAVICSDRCGSKDLVRYGKVGEIFEAGNAKSLAKSLERLLLEKGYLGQCQRNAVAYQTKIDPVNAVEYFERVITGERVKAPWIISH